MFFIDKSMTPFFKQIFATVFFFKIFEITLDFLGMENLLFSNEEIAIAILFYLFVSNVKKSFGSDLLKGLLEKGEYLQDLHERFAKEKYIYLESKKKNFLGMKKMSKNFLLPKEFFEVQKIEQFFRMEQAFFEKILQKDIHQFYQKELPQVQMFSRQNLELDNVSFLKNIIHRVCTFSYIYTSRKNNSTYSSINE